LIAKVLCPLSPYYIFIIGGKYKRQSSDTTSAYRHIPLFQYPDFSSFYSAVPYDCRLIGVEILDQAHNIKNFVHPERAVYLLGNEGRGLSKTAIEKCHSFVKIPSERCLNVSCSGSIVLFHRRLQYAE